MARGRVNCSNRSFIRAGGSVFTGFVVTGNERRSVLVRAIGPSLTAFGISDALADPKLALTSSGQLLAQNNDWDAGGAISGAESIRRTSEMVGAFPLANNSRDSAIIVQLAPGAYVAEASAASAADTGQVLVEVYLLP
jgi:hypothetical protein